MKIVAAAVVSFFLSGSGFAQSQSVWIGASAINCCGLTLISF